MESFDDYMKRREDRLNGVPKQKKERKGLRPVSKKQSKKLQAYKKARDEHYSSDENKRCAICGRTNGLSIHHESKRGNEIANADRFITLCLIGSYLDELYPELNHSHTGGCHGFIEANKSWAREKGYLK